MLCCGSLYIRDCRTHSFCYTPFFFFSSRRRHTRCSRDWSSVCSSDLKHLGFDHRRRVHPGRQVVLLAEDLDLVDPEGRVVDQLVEDRRGPHPLLTPAERLLSEERSEERRVGKECRARW